MRNPTWIGGDRSNHELHEHVQSRRDDRRGLGSEEGGREGIAGQAMGQDELGSRIESGHRLLDALRLGHVSGHDRVQLGRLRLHYLHREFRAATVRGVRCDPRWQLDRRSGTVRKPKLRGPRAFGCARQLLGIAAAGRGVRHRREHGYRPYQGALGRGSRRQPCLFGRSLAKQQGDRPHDQKGDWFGLVQGQLRQCLRR